MWALTGFFAFAAVTGIAAKRAYERRVPPMAVEDDLRDAVASPTAMPTLAGLSGKPVATAWFRTPEQRRAEMDAALMSSRRRRAARRASAQ